MSSIFWLWKRCDWCGKISFLGLGWLKVEGGKSLNDKISDANYCSGICRDHLRRGYDVDSGDKAKGGW